MTPAVKAFVEFILEQAEEEARQLKERQEAMNGIRGEGQKD